MSRSCPDCGADLPPAADRGGDLVALGYLHRDYSVDCRECGETAHFGVPVDGPTDGPPACPVCGGRIYPYKLDFHRAWESIDVHWKCEECYYRFNGDLDHLTEDVYSLGVRHLEGRRDDA